MICLLLLLAVIALATDTMMNDGGYTKTAWRELSKKSVQLVGPEQKEALVGGPHS